MTGAPPSQRVPAGPFVMSWPTWPASPKTGSSGLRSRPPNDAETAAQVARFDGRDVDSIVAAWNSTAAQLDKLAANDGVKAPLADIVVHEHDIRGAIAQPGHRDSAAVTCASDQLLSALQPPTPLLVTVEDAEYHCGPDESPEMQLRTTRFEATPVAHRSAQPIPTRGHGLVGRPRTGTRPPVPVRAGRCRSRRVRPSLTPPYRAPASAVGTHG